MKRLAIALTLIGSTAAADPGYLNQEGCHYGSSDGWRGMYHCHHAARSYYDGNRGLRTHRPQQPHRPLHPTHTQQHNEMSTNDALGLIAGIIILDALLNKK